MIEHIPNQIPELDDQIEIPVERRVELIDEVIARDTEEPLPVVAVVAPTKEAPIPVVETKEKPGIFSGFAKVLAKYANMRAIKETNVTFGQPARLQEIMTKSLENTPKDQASLLARSMKGLTTLLKIPKEKRGADFDKKKLAFTRQLDSFKPVKGLLEKSFKARETFDKSTINELDGLLSANKAVFQAIRSFNPTGDLKHDISTFKEIIDEQLEDLHVPDELHSTPKETTQFYRNLFSLYLKDRMREGGDRRKTKVLEEVVKELDSKLEQ